MANTRYRVEYQVFLTVRFERERMLSGPDFRTLWVGTRLFGTKKVQTLFWHLDTVSSTRKENAFPIGDDMPLLPLLARDSRPIFGGGTCGQSTGRSTDIDFSFLHEPGGRSFGVNDTLPNLMLGVSGQWFEQTGPNEVLSLMRASLEVTDRHRPPYGLIDLAASEDCYAGCVYLSSMTTGNVPVHRWAEQMRVAHANANRRVQARNIYWGNYFGPAILDRLGGRGAFLARFQAQARDVGGQADALVWEFANGVFVSLCLDPLGCRPDRPLHGAAQKNLRWLLHDLGPRGVLDPWS